MLKSVIHLTRGEVYFHAAFLDENLTIPVIETWIYRGLDSEDGHTFSDAYDEKKQYCFQDGITSNVLDRKALSEWLLQEHSSTKIAKGYDYRGE